MLLTSTRAIPHATVDDLSDHDVILVVRDIHRLLDSHAWVADFGEILVAYWDPVEPDEDTGIERSGNIVQYADGHKIDFTFWPVAQIERLVDTNTLPDELDAGYRVLLDKDDLAGRMPLPSYRAYIPTPPDESAFRTNVNDFFVGPPYVAKCLLRGELLPAKWCLDYDMRHVYLHPMLEWYVGCRHEWSIPVGSLGKGMKKLLPTDLWSDLETTFAGADIEENWDALFRMLALYRRVAREVGEALGYDYPEEFDERVTEFVHRMRTR